MESELLIRSPGFPLWVMKMPKALSFPLVPHSPCTLQDLPSLDAFLSLPGSAPTEAAFLGLPPGPTGNNHTPCSPSLACRPCHSHTLAFSPQRPQLREPPQKSTRLWVETSTNTCLTILFGLSRQLYSLATAPSLTLSVVTTNLLFSPQILSQMCFQSQRWLCLLLLLR